MDKLEGYVEKIIFRNEENGYTVLSIENEGCSTTCVGVFNYVGEGEYLEIDGKFVFHPRYGAQFKAASFRSIRPQTEDAIERYLSSGAIKGIGPVTARRVIEKFGADALRIIDEEPERLSEIKGISLRKAREIGAGAEGKKELRQAMVFLGQYGISNAMAIKVYAQYGEDIYEIVKNNPYRLAEDISGIGFRKADEIASLAGVAPDSEYRIKSCIIYMLEEAAQEGNVYLPEEELKFKVRLTLGSMSFEGGAEGETDITSAEAENAEIERCIGDLAIDTRVIIKKKDGERQVYYSLYYYTELNIASDLLRLNLRGKAGEKEILEKISRTEKELDITLDEAQRDALKAAANSGVLVITGGPGTGKTTIINAIIKYFEQDYKEILLAAPTGRASKRMSEATGREAKTIHRMLELSYDLQDTSAGARYNRNEDCPLEADIVIVDEMSMVDVFLMNALLRAIAAGTRLILVGDVDQLPSVGPGNVLRDIIDSGCVNTVRLTKIFRQAAESAIVTNAHKINAGEDIELRPDCPDFIFIERDNANIIPSSILTLVRDKLPGYIKADMREIQVLSPMKKGILGTESLNTFLQRSLNPKSPEKNEIPVKGLIFREGDKVMHIKNNYDLEWEMRMSGGIAYEKGKGVFNGDIGMITRINESRQILEVLFDDGRYADYDFEQLTELTLAYATTVHKSQGSEYAAVVLPLFSGPGLLMTRNILYTAVTRAKTCVCIVGKSETVRRMIKNARQAERYSALKDRISEVKEHIL